MKRAHRDDDVFAIPQLWQRSRWLDDALEPTSSFFSSSLTNISGLELGQGTSISQLEPGPQLESNISCLGKLPDSSTTNTGFFKLPAIYEPSVNDPEHSETPAHHEGQSPNQAQQESKHDDDNSLELWMDLDAPATKPALYKTWDGFLSGEQAPTQPLYLSEAGPSAYDALLAWDTDPLELRNAQVPIVETQAYLASLLSLAAGRESVFFVKSPDSTSFKPCLETLRLSGYSSNTTKGLERQCLDCGQIFVRLKAFVQKNYTKQAGRCTIALSSALNRIAQILQQQLDVDFHSPRSLLQLQSNIDKIYSVLQPLNGLMTQAEVARTDDQLLDLVFKHACVMERKEVFVRDLMQEILRIVSLPWLELLEEWIGTKAEQGMPFTKANVGETRGFVKVESETCLDDFGEEFEDIDYRLDPDSLPGFFPTDIAQLALDTGRNLRFIETSCPSNPLISARHESITRLLDAPVTEWVFGWNDVQKLEQKIAKYQDDLKAAISGTYNVGVNPRLSNSIPSWAQSEAHSLFGATETDIQNMLLASMTRFAAPLEGCGTDDRFAAILKHNLPHSNVHPKSFHPISTPHPSLLPIVSFGGIIAAQAEIVNKESLRLLFETHNLRQHLDLQRSFHLLGNGIFCAQLSHALFDPDLETAERQAGIARQGGVMGLRLGSRDTWPPASSELRLALMGILAESFDAEHRVAEVPTKSSTKSDSLPGDLSFAVRDLSPEDIEKCMNPDSLEALDFLRLAYSTPQELRVVITPAILVQYDRIFKFLLRLLRLMYVVDQLFRVVNLRTSAWSEPGNIAYRFAREARHFVSCISAYFLDSGIALAWQTFQSKLDEMQNDLLAQADTGLSEKACSPETLREYHSQALNQMTSALFLRRRQQPVLKLLEDIFITVLTYAKHARLQALGSVVEGEHTKAYSTKLYRDFKKKVQVFVTVCKTLTEKTKSGNKSKDGGIHSNEGLGEDSMVSQLLLKLDINQYYTK